MKLKTALDFDLDLAKNCKDPDKLKLLFFRIKKFLASHDCSDKEKLKFNSIFYHLAKNPYSPIDLLMKLTDENSDEILENRQFEFELLSNPNFLSELKDYHLIPLLASKKCPKYLVDYAFHYRQSDKVIRKILMIYHPYKYNNHIKDTELSGFGIENITIKDVYFENSLFSGCMINNVTFDYSKLKLIAPEKTKLHISLCSLKEVKFISCNIQSNPPLLILDQIKDMSEHKKAKLHNTSYAHNLTLVDCEGCIHLLTLDTIKYERCKPKNIKKITKKIKKVHEIDSYYEIELESTKK